MVNLLQPRLNHSHFVRNFLLQLNNRSPDAGQSDGQYTALRMQREPMEQWGYDKLMTGLRETLSADEIAQLAAEGAARSEDQAVEEALQV
ncbi:MAG: hypothetical protein JO092_04110 [Candidatus Eremiobacteraeota bacterium]|nr:hypothetical protein [Candidatus Eremiobacteraeota bacterium]